MATSTNPSSAQQSQRVRPVHEIRLGAIRAAIWENRTEQATRHNVTITRTYKVNDEWKDTSSFARDDLLLVAKVVDMAHSWIFSQSDRQLNARQT